VRLEAHADRRKTAGELTDELSALGARLMVEVLADSAPIRRCRSLRTA
jgi:hypothetical protein